MLEEARLSVLEEASVSDLQLFSFWEFVNLLYRWESVQCSSAFPLASCCLFGVECLRKQSLGSPGLALCWKGALQRWAGLELSKF